MTLPLGLKESSEFARDSSFLSLLLRLDREDLSRIVNRLARRKGESLDVIVFYKSQFLRFFALATYLNISVAPNSGIDSFWHELILDTKFYRDFCNRHCGYFFHHEPFDDETPIQIIEAAIRSDDLISKHFLTENIGSQSQSQLKCAHA